MNEMVANVIDIDPEHRYLVEYDWDNEMEWVIGDSIGFQTTRIARGLNRIVTYDKYGKVFERIVSEQSPDDFVNGWSKVERIFALYLRLSGVRYKHIELQGHSQGEWCEGIAYLPENETLYNKDGRDKLDSRIALLRDWWRGDVYQVTSQELVTYYTPDGRKTYQQWERVEGSDTFGGIVGNITLDTCNELFGY